MPLLKVQVSRQKYFEVLFTKRQRFIIEELRESAPELGLESQSSGVVPGKSGV